MRLIVATILAAASLSAYGDTSQEAFKAFAEQLGHASTEATQIGGTCAR